MFRFKTTNQHIKYWKNRKIDWAEAYLNLDHPHRDLIIDRLRELHFNTIVEVGCAAGANLIRIHQAWPNILLGGCDVSRDALKVAEAHLPKTAVLDVASADRLFFPPKAPEVVLTDMCLIYLSPRRFRKALAEIKRVAKKHVMFVEFHSPSLLRRLALLFGAGYYAYDYRRELEKAGYFDIRMEKVSEKDWPGGEPQKEFCYLIQASV